MVASYDRSHHAHMSSLFAQMLVSSTSTHHQQLSSSFNSLLSDQRFDPLSKIRTVRLTGIDSTLRQCRLT